MNFNRIFSISLNLFLAVAWLAVGICYLIGIKLNYESVFLLMTFVLAIHYLIYALEYINNK